MGVDPAFYSGKTKIFRNTVEKYRTTKIFKIYYGDLKINAIST